MPSRAYLKAAETWEEERQMNELNESLARAQKRAEIALALARSRYKDDDDVEIVGRPDNPNDPCYLHLEGGVIEPVDGGYWIEARVFVYADDVECPGHEPDPGHPDQPMGETVYCDGTCRIPRR